MLDVITILAMLGNLGWVLVAVDWLLVRIYGDEAVQEWWERWVFDPLYDLRWRIAHWWRR